MICFAAFNQTDITCDACGIKKAGAYFTQVSVNTALPPWVHERFEPYMTEECFDRFIASAEYDIPYMAYIYMSSIWKLPTLK